MKDKYIIVDPSGLYLTSIDSFYAFGNSRNEALKMSDEAADEIVNEIKSMKLKKEAA